MSEALCTFCDYGAFRINDHLRKLLFNGMKYKKKKTHSDFNCVADEKKSKIPQKKTCMA